MLLMLNENVAYVFFMEIQNKKNNKNEKRQIFFNFNLKNYLLIAHANKNLLYHLHVLCILF